jgi:hypothetical protein
MNKNFFDKFINGHVLVRQISQLSNIWTFTVLSAFGLFFYVKNLNFLFVGSSDSIDGFISEFGNSDRATLLELALNWGERSQEQYSWILNIWPPGSALLNLFILQFSSNIYVLQFMWATLSFVLWMNVVSITLNLVPRKQRMVIFISLLIIFNSTIFHLKFYSSTMLMSDSIATPLGILALLNLYKGLDTGIRRYYLKFGFLIGIAAHFRAIWLKDIEIILLVATIVYFVYTSKKSTSNKSAKNKIQKTKFLLIGSAIAYVSTFPYRIFQVYSGKSFFKWGMDNEQIWASAWIRTVENNSWLSNSGISPACSIEPTQCVTFSASAVNMGVLADAAKKVFLENPIEWILFRIKYLLQGILTDFKFEMPNADISVFGIFVLLSYLIFVSIIVTEMYSYKNWKVIVLSLPFLGDFGSMIYFHVENRYFLPSIMTNILVMSIFLPKYIRAGEVRK